ncbi:hypothetical protein C7212DRAFT_360824 [Tuber magnatum]|uniref:Mis18 domain-containing protein n=1 Tax=Tuber magnatum TaxID=42249 RepID=A0A317SY61_9PEZI|nr:hypothetical protein C7212DRAFT_360824 [Tuber magnatum]
MPSPKPQAGGDNNNPSRELSPYFSLPNQDGESNGGEIEPIECPPVTVSCANCERIVGDNSAFLYATRQMGTITLGSMVSVVVGEGGLKTSLEGEWDEFCNYKNITCGKCGVFLGKMYMATTAKLSTLQNKYTLPLTTLSFYHHSSRAPSLPPAQTQEIYAHLHPSPESTAENIDRVMTMCVMLHEKQGDIIRGLKKVATAARVDVDLDSPSEIEEVREGVRDKIELLDKLESKLTLLDGLAQRVGVVETHVGAAVGREPAPQQKDQGTAAEKRTLVRNWAYWVLQIRGRGSLPVTQGAVRRWGRELSWIFLGSTGRGMPRVLRDRPRLQPLRWQQRGLGRRGVSMHLTARRCWRFLSLRLK